ncbi:hypothetical protein FOZ60_003289 [Perkinsus olseni]|uniref:Enoyl-CoA delta isomerase 2, mitochondrial n=1 Tax=Perkinsus olseni TaxID=32597 RepID=A0A7J6NVQ5_PEROL|nr:hypothetical protein FOZ60_003289 [Perkinsus olseni]
MMIHKGRASSILHKLFPTVVSRCLTSATLNVEGGLPLNTLYRGKYLTYTTTTLNNNNKTTTMTIGIITLTHEEGEGSSSECRYDWGTRKCENRFTTMMLSELSSIITKVNTTTDDDDLRCLIITQKPDNRFWSNGLDLKWIAHNKDKANDLIILLHKLMSDIITLPIPTIAVMYGHATAAGLLLAMCCDYRIVHKDNKSLYFVPAVSLGLHYTPGMIELIKSKVACNTARDMLCYSTRYNAQQALQAGILDYLISNTEAHHQPLVAAINLITVIIITTHHVLCYYCYYQENIIVRPFNKESLGKVKRGMYDTVIKNLIHHDDDDAMGINRLLSSPRSSL